MKIREMNAADITTAAELDKEAFNKAWKEQDFTDELVKDYSHYCIAENESGILAYAGIWCIYETAELIRIASHPKMRRCGASSELMEHILVYAKNKGCEKMMLEVRKSNSAAQALYKKYGFCKTAVRCGYYDGEDAIIMEREL